MLSSTISQACSDSHHFPLAAFKLLIDIIYLTQLIGIKSIAFGVASSLVFIPLSTRLSKKHQTLQTKVSQTHNTLSNLMSESLQDLRKIRLSSMEQPWKEKIISLRDQELNQIWRAGATLAVLTLLTNLGPISLASVSLSVYSYESGHLSPSVAFASLGLFSNLYEIFHTLPEMASSLHQSWISCQRVQQYLADPEQALISSPSDNISIDNATLTWINGHGPSPTSSRAEVFKLRDIDVAFPKGGLSLITGNTGSGKSLLVASIFEEAKLESGFLKKPVPLAWVEKGLSSSGETILPGTMALVSQPPWIENRSIRDNILFGYPFNGHRYRTVLNACALNQDLNAMPDGDLTKAGVNGATLSGGQKWRIALARALYSPAEILILEDVLSAIDAPVAKWICDKALVGGQLVKGRTRILVTQQPELCINAASCLVTVEAGTAKSQLMAPKAKTVSRRSTGLAKTMAQDTKTHKETAENSTPPSASLPPSSGSMWQILIAYLWASGGLNACLLGILVTFGAQLSSASHSWWLMMWTRNEDIATQDTIQRNIIVYLALSIDNGIFLTLQSLIILILGIRASGSLFRGIVSSILAAPLQWIDSTPLGRVLQRLESDMYAIDYRMASEMNDFLGSIIHLCIIIFIR